MEKLENKYFIMDDSIVKNEDFSQDFLKNGENIYEVIRIIKGKALFFEEHLERLKNSFSIINKKLSISDEIVKERILKLIRENENAYGNVKIVINLNKKETFFAYYIPHSYPEERLYKEGIKTISVSEERENPNAKIINSPLRERVNKLLKEKDAYEAILIDKNGYIREGSRSNIFMVRGENLITSPKEDVLMGVTRKRIIEICNKNNIKVIEERVKYDDIYKIEGLFMTGTSPKILPIKILDNVNFSSVTNEIIKKVMRLYDEEINLYLSKKL